MINIYNMTNKCVYKAELRMWNEENEQYDPDILQEIDIDLMKKWDSMINMFVMDQEELDAWRDFWIDEVSDAIVGRSDLLYYADYNFVCVKED